jgi:hypothetical protein
MLIAELFEEVCRVPPYGHNGIWLDDVEGDFLLERDPRWRHAAPDRRRV